VTPVPIPQLSGTHGPRATTVGPDGLAYFMNSDNRVYRFPPDATMRTPTVVTTTLVANATALRFEPAGTLLVVVGSSSTAYRYTLGGATMTEVSRAIVPVMGCANLRALAFDERGGAYLACADLTNSLVHVPSIGAASDRRIDMGQQVQDLDFGTGALDCHDLYYVYGTSSPRMIRRHVSPDRGADVPWHR
jgi:hypothetical protein